MSEQLVRVRCHTAIDDYKSVDWPSWMVAMPRVGDFVEGRRGEGAGSRPKLRVVAVTHSREPESYERQNLVPVLLVELHK